VTPAKSGDLLVMKDVTKTYHVGELDVPVLRGVSLVVARGELVALMGASGSGKTTLMNVLGCLDSLTSGSYRISGREVGDLSADERADVRGREIGFVFQSFNLLQRTSAIENVTMPLEYSSNKADVESGEERAAKLLERFGLGRRKRHTPSQLSGGEQQRVAIARALINRPALLLADEPTGNLDSKTSVEVLRIFRELNDEQGITILLVTHDPGVAKQSKRTVRIKDGVIVRAERAVPQESAA